MFSMDRRTILPQLRARVVKKAMAACAVGNGVVGGDKQSDAKIDGVIRLWSIVLQYVFVIYKIMIKTCVTP